MADFNPAFEKMIRYDSESGKFYWLAQRGRAIKPGDQVKGSVSHGYLIFSINRKNYLAHRLAWFLTFNKFPNQQIDHINHDKLDNRLCNLREASASQNQWNKKRQRNNSTGFKGVSFHSQTGLYRARIKHFGKELLFGCYKTPNEANEAVQKARLSLHKEFAEF
jgi:hypothetical protein